MNTYCLDEKIIDSVDLKCLLVSRGMTVDNSVYRALDGKYRVDMNPLTCNCLILSDGTISQLTDVSFHLRYLSGILSWSNLKLLRYASQLGTPFSIRMDGDIPALFYNNSCIDHITFPEPTDFYQQKTIAGMPFIGNSVLQGLDWIAFQCLWSCDYAAAGKSCEYCFSGGDFEGLARRGKPMPEPVKANDLADVVCYAVSNVSANALQITGGSTFDGRGESKYIIEYLEALLERGLSQKLKENILFITPPKDMALIDEYFEMGVSRIACSVEVWDENTANVVTPGKMAFTTRKAYLDALEYISEKYGPSKATTNFIIGLEEFDTFAEGARAMAERGIFPNAPIWMPMGRPVQGSMKAPALEYYQRAKELLAELYVKYDLYAPEGRGTNVCVETEIMRYAGR